MARRQISRLTMLFLFLMGSRAHQDACFHIEPSSVCEESGLCTITGIACDDAYIALGKSILVERNEPPMTPSMDDKVYRILSELHPGAFASIPIWTTSPYYRNLTEKLEMVVMKFQNQFPKIIADIPLIRELVDSAALFELHVVDELFLEFGDDPRAFNRIRYYHEVVYNSLLADVDMYFDSIVGYVQSLDYSDDMREAILAQMIPYAHAVLRMNQYMRVPGGLIGQPWIEALTFMSRYDPLYTYSEDEKIWTIPLIISEHTRLLPITPSDIGRFADIVFETFTSLDRDAILNEISVELRSYIIHHGTPFERPRFYQFMRSSLIYLDSNDPDTTAEFCQAHQEDFLEYFRIQTRRVEIHAHTSLLALFRICGSDYFTMQDRVSIVLPVLIGRHQAPRHTIEYTNGTLPLPIHVVRQQQVSFTWAAYGSQPNQHAKFLSSYISTKLRNPPTRPRQLHALGSAIALLVIEGDSHGALYKSFLSGTSIADLYRNSVSVRRGFCEVINCVVVDTLFHESEIPALIRLIKTNPVLNFDKMRSLRSAAAPQIGELAGLESLLAGLNFLSPTR